MHLATPPPHPSEAPVTNPNPLATTPVPPTAGVKLSLVVVSPRKVVPQLYKLGVTSSERSNLAHYSIKESEKESRASNDTSSDDVSPQPFTNGSMGRAPAFGASNTLLTNATGGKDSLKRRKPKTNMVKSNSSYISRVIPHEAMNKRLQERNQDGLFAFANINRAFQWLDLSTNVTFKVSEIILVWFGGIVSNIARKAEHLTKILFTKAHMLCHDVNPLTQSPSHLDVIMGSSSADLIWYEPMTQKYNRINKNV